MTQISLWILAVAPWFILFFLDKKKVRRYLSVTFFTVFLTSIFWQVAEVYRWWVIEETLPFLSTISAFNYGMLPVITLIFFYFFYERPVLFFIVNIIGDAIQAFVISPFLFQKLNYYRMENMSNVGLFLHLCSYVPIIFIYQKVYDHGRHLD